MPPESCSDGTNPAEFFAVATECFFHPESLFLEPHFAAR